MRWLGALLSTPLATIGLFVGLSYLSTLWFEQVLRPPPGRGAPDPEISRRVFAKYPFTEVPSFQRNAHLVGRGMTLDVIDTAAGSGPESFHTMARYERGPKGWSANLENTGIQSVPGERAVVTANGRVLHRIGLDGTESTVIDLEDIDLRWKFDRFLSWAGETGPLYFTIEQDRKHLIARCDPDTGAMAILEIGEPGIMVEVDPGTDTVFWVHRDAGKLGDRLCALPFSGGAGVHEKSSHAPWGHLDLSPGGDRLLLSGGGLLDAAGISIVETSTLAETVLPIEGKYAVWADDDSIFFLRGENTLWKYDLGKPEPILLIEIEGTRRNPRSSYASAPTLSRDRTWLYWGCTLTTEPRGRQGCVIIDLLEREYRVYPDCYWHHVAWVDSDL